MKICWQESSRFPWGIKFIKGTCDRIKQPLFFFKDETTRQCPNSKYRDTQDFGMNVHNRDVGVIYVLCLFAEKGLTTGGFIWF